MSIETLKQSLPDYAKDIKLNLSTLMGESSELTSVQVMGIALASALATRHPEVIAALTAEATPMLSEPHLQAAKAAAIIMAMNNVYYRFLQLVENPEYKTLPAGLRMNVIANPGIEKTDFELYSLAVSAINGCGTCIKSHADVVRRAGISLRGVQLTVKIAAVINASAQALHSS